MFKRSTTSVAILLLLVLGLSQALFVREVHASDTLKSGMKGEDVMMLQQELSKLGFFNASPTGYYGEITLSAVKNFQKAYGLYPDGVAGKNTVNRIKELLYDKILEKEMEGDEVFMLQESLKRLGYFSVKPTGYFGDLTEAAVLKFQKANGLYADGVAGIKTLSLLRDILAGAQKSGVKTSRSSSRNVSYKTPWFGGVDKIFKRGADATVYDIKSGLSFRVKRTFGTNHADVEPVSKEDTAVMKRIYGGSWSWSRRAIIVTVNGRRIAASMNGMPHAGLDKYASGKYISNRSAGYGYGYNYDTVKNNGMNGHFCIHFYKSRLHVNNKVDPLHQEKVEEANQWAQRNY